MVAEGTPKWGAIWAPISGLDVFLFFFALSTFSAYCFASFSSRSDFQDFPSLVTEKNLTVHPVIRDAIGRNKEQQ